MPSGRTPDGPAALSNAERQARRRSKMLALRPPLPRRRGEAGRSAGTTRWPSCLRSTVQAECATWFEALPESLRESSTADALQEMIDLHLEAIATVQPPRGYGRD